MDKYTTRRIWAVVIALLIVILSIIGAVKTVQFMADFLNEDFICQTETDVLVKSGDSITILAQEQIVSKNCTGYQSLTGYLVDEYGTELQPGDVIHIPLHK